MTFRARLSIAFAAATLLPLGLLAVGVRRQIVSRLSAQHARRVEALARVAIDDLSRERASIDGRLHALASGLADDNSLRRALITGGSDERSYVLDWAKDAMRVTGLSMLQLQDEQGRILSSGHFRNEFDRLEPTLPRLLIDAADSIALVAVRAPDGRFLALARVDSARMGGRRFTLVGGVIIDRALLANFTRDDELAIALVTPDDTLGSFTSADSAHGAAASLVRPSPDDHRGLAAERALVYIDAGSSDSTRVGAARLIITQSPLELDALVRSVDRWFYVALVIAGGAALGLALWLSAGLSRPVAELANATSTVDLDGPDLSVAIDRDDEVGALARRFAAMMRRLRASASRLRDAERRATVGEMARQVNHDIKNGLIPIRNVMRHLVEVQEQRPAELPTVFGERRATLESSIAYLDTLARNYARLTPQSERQAFDVNDVVRALAASTQGGDGVIELQLASSLPRVLGDPVVLRRILDNVLRNAIESLPSSGGRVRLATSAMASDIVRVLVTDTGRGMTEQELDRAFDDFFTTKPEGTGLGLSVVRRLTADLQGSLRVTSAPGKGTTFVFDFASANGRSRDAGSRVPPRTPGSPTQRKADA